MKVMNKESRNKKKKKKKKKSAIDRTYARLARLAFGRFRSCFYFYLQHSFCFFVLDVFFGLSGAKHKSILSL